MKKIHGKLDTSEVYNNFRSMHSILKDIYSAGNYKELCKKYKNLDLAATELEEWLYFAEKQVSEF